MYLVFGSIVYWLKLLHVFSGVVWDSNWYILSRSAITSRGVCRPDAQLRIIQAVSWAPRKPRAHPVPMGQNGWKSSRVAFISLSIYFHSWSILSKDSLAVCETTGGNLRQDWWRPELVNPPPADCLQPRRPAACGRHVQWPVTHAQHDTSMWSRTWPRLPGHSGCGQTQGLAADDWLTPQLPPWRRQSVRPGQRSCAPTGVLGHHSPASRRRVINIYQHTGTQSTHQHHIVYYTPVVRRLEHTCSMTPSVCTHAVWYLLDTCRMTPTTHLLYDTYYIPAIWYLLQTCSMTPNTHLLYDTY